MQRLESDGERMIPTYHKGNIIYGEHLGRYLAVADAVKNKTVLDIASGTGYGSKLLAKDAKYVYAIDIDKATIEYAKENFQAANIKYQLGSGTDIPMEDDSVDCVVSMETIEHIKNQDKFLDEIRRVTKPGGFLVVSTPNDKVYPKGNHFHVKEHNKLSLRKLLGKYFKNIEIYYQIVSISASVMAESDILNGDLRAHWDLYKQYKSQPDESIYFIGVCSDAKTPKLKNVSILSQEYSHKEQKQLTDYINGLLKRSDIQENLIKKLDKEKSDQGRRLAELEIELADIYRSRAWKIAHKAAKIKRRLGKKL